jgi:hypothetical protein
LSKFAGGATVTAGVKAGAFGVAVDVALAVATDKVLVARIMTERNAGHFDSKNLMGLLPSDGS